MERPKKDKHRPHNQPQRNRRPKATVNFKVLNLTEEELILTDLSCTATTDPVPRLTKPRATLQPSTQNVLTMQHSTRPRPTVTSLNLKTEIMSDRTTTLSITSLTMKVFVALVEEAEVAIVRLEEVFRTQLTALTALLRRPTLAIDRNTLRHLTTLIRVIAACQATVKKAVAAMPTVGSRTTASTTMATTTIIRIGRAITNTTIIRMGTIRITITPTTPLANI